VVSCSSARSCGTSRRSPADVFATAAAAPSAQVGEGGEGLEGGEGAASEGLTAEAAAGDATMCQVCMRVRVCVCVSAASRHGHGAARSGLQLRSRVLRCLHGP
jgi:hypothetical protein